MLQKYCLDSFTQNWHKKNTKKMKKKINFFRHSSCIVQSPSISQDFEKSKIWIFKKQKKHNSLSGHNVANTKYKKKIKLEKKMKFGFSLLLVNINIHKTHTRLFSNKYCNNFKCSFVPLYCMRGWCSMLLKIICWANFTSYLSDCTLAGLFRHDPTTTEWPLKGVPYIWI